MVSLCICFLVYVCAYLASICVPGSWCFLLVWLISPIFTNGLCMICCSIGTRYRSVAIKLTDSRRRSCGWTDYSFRAQGPSNYRLEISSSTRTSVKELTDGTGLVLE